MVMNFRKTAVKIHANICFLKKHYTQDNNVLGNTITMGNGTFKLQVK